MTDRESRERLVEMIQDAVGGCAKHWAEIIADYLLSNGAIVPPCKVGDSIFRVGNGEIWEWLIEHIEIYEDEIGFVDDGENYFTPDKIGKTVFLTKEEAEEKLKEREKV